MRPDANPGSYGDGIESSGAPEAVKGDCLYLLVSMTYATYVCQFEDIDCQQEIGFPGISDLRELRGGESAGMQVATYRKVPAAEC
jgi:hypothetical protein